MRTSQRSEILEAALRVMNAAEGGDITLDAVAHEAGLTKPGLLYHFRNRDVLLAAIVDHAAANVENDMTATLGKPLENANATERLLSYVHVAAHGVAKRAELIIWGQATYRPELTEPWTTRMGRWLELPDDLDAATRARLTTARLAADGLWGAQATGVSTLHGADLEAVVSSIRSLIEGTTP